MVLIKVHEDYKKIVAICDSDLIGKRFEEGKLQLHVNEHFYKGEEFNDIKALKILKDAQQDDACFNFVGKKAIDLGAKAGIIDKNRVLVIQGVPHALALL
jgi:uncharacterized protein